MEGGHAARPHYVLHAYTFDFGHTTSKQFATALITEYWVTQQPTYGWYDYHGSTAASIAVGGHNTDCVYHIVGYSDWNTCSTGGDHTNTWTDSDSVVDWSPTTILWGLPLHCEDHTVLTNLLNSVGGGPGRRGEICWDRKTNIKLNLTQNDNNG